SSEGLTKMICVVQPSPCAKCGMLAGRSADEERSIKGSAVIKQFERSLVWQRRAATEIGTPALNVNVRARTEPLKGPSLRNLETCPLAGILKLPVPKSCPVSSVKKKEKDAAWAFGFAITIPVSTAPPISA